MDFKKIAHSNSSFSGAIKEDNSIILYRDHMGVKPMYYYLKGKNFFYSEDMREFSLNDKCDLSINENLFYLYNVGATDLSLTETEFKYIHAVKPGSWCEFKPTEDGWDMTEHVYWEPGQNKYKCSSDEEYIKKFRELIEDAIKIRADYAASKVGCEFSGGLDSSVIGILLNRKEYDTSYYSWSKPLSELPLQPVDERTVIEDICKAENITCDYIDYSEELYDISTLPPFANTLELSRSSKHFSEQGIKYVFTGHGGDEAVSHRCSPLELWVHKEYRAFFHELWHQTEGKKLRPLRFLNRCRYYLFIDLPRSKKSWHIDNRDISPLLNKNFAEKMKDTPRPPLYFKFDPRRYILQGGSRPRLDNCYVQGKEYGVEYLFPFLDYRVVDFALSMPRRLFLKDGVTRWAYREAFKDIMPESLYNVDYKDFASLRPNEDAVKEADVKPEEKAEETKPQDEFDQNKWAEEYLSVLDWDYWGQYFDRAECEKLLKTPFKEYTEDQARLFFYFNVSVNKCILIQNMRNKLEKI